MTRRDVALAAGTSPAVVSYVLNDGPRPVAAETRARVLAAVDRLGYRPNAIARSLRTQRSSTLGLIVPDSSDPFFAALSRSVEDAAYARGYLLLVGNAAGSLSRFVGYLRAFLDQHVDGLAVIPPGAQSDWVQDLRASATPSVVLDRAPDGLGLRSVVCDNEAGATKAVEHLITAHGRQRVGCVAGPATLPVAADRVAGWRAALQAAGLPARPEWVVHAEYDRGAGYRAAVTLLDGGHEIDALFVGSDVQAMGALRAASDRGARLPEDLPMIGFDGIAEGGYTVPRLSTVQQPVRELAQTVVRCLLDEPQSATATNVLPTTLRLRESCGCRSGSGRLDGVTVPRARRRARTTTMTTMSPLAHRASAASPPATEGKHP